MKRKTSKPGATATARPGKAQIVSLEVSIISGPLTEGFARKNPILSRTIEIRGDQTLRDLHEAIFDAFDREEEHMYEFQVGGRRPMDPKARCYVLPMAMDDPFGERKPAGDVEQTAIASLGFEPGEVFGYWFDFGDDWWHRIEVLSIDERVPRGRLPEVTARVGESPPQYADWDEET